MHRTSPIQNNLDSTFDQLVRTAICDTWRSTGRKVWHVPVLDELDPILVEVVRSGFVESVHRGRVAIVSSDGRLTASLGADVAPIYPRSAYKPLQAVGMLRAGLGLTGELLALVCGSHSGEAFHQAGVRRILDESGEDESVLQTPPDWPLDELERETAMRNGAAKSPVAMNCSGKHAGMIMTTVRNNGDVRTYLDPNHPTQLAILRAISDLADERATNLAVDGCGAPVYAISLYALARAFGRLAAAADGAEAQVANAMRAHPKYVSGTRRDEFELHQAMPGLIAKSGAEAVYVTGLPDGCGIAIKISDGSSRARPAAMAGVLMRLGFDSETLRKHASLPVLGHGERVGEVRPCAETLGLLGQ